MRRLNPTSLHSMGLGNEEEEDEEEEEEAQMQK